MRQISYKINDKLGIHARPAGLLSKLAASFPCKITISKDEKEADLKRILGVMGLGAKHGDEIKIVTEGEKEDDAIIEIENFLIDNL